MNRRTLVGTNYNNFPNPDGPVDHDVPVLRVEGAAAGQRSAVNLAGVEVAEIERGQTLGMPGAFEQTRVADASIELLPNARPLKHGTRVRFHQGTAEILGRVAVIGPIERAPESVGGAPTRAVQSTVPVVTPGTRAMAAAASAP